MKLKLRNFSCKKCKYQGDEKKHVLSQCEIDLLLYANESCPNFKQKNWSFKKAVKEWMQKKS